MKKRTTTLSSSLDQATGKLLSRLDQFNKLREIANKKNYPYKINQIHAKVLEEYKFWTRKESITGPIHKLADLKKDLLFIESQLNNPNLNKERIDILAEKYSISYGKRNSGDSPQIY